MPRLGGRIALVALVVLAPVALVVVGASPAGAHAYLVGSNPGDGDRVSEAPRELRLQFSEHVVLTATRIEVHTGDGAVVPVGEMRLETADAADTEEPAAVVARVPDLAPGAYRVSWETLSSDDLHRTSGLIVFGVDRDVAPAGVVSASVRPEEAVLRGGLLACLAVAIGGLLALDVLRRSLSPAAAAVAHRVVARLGSAAALVAPLLAVALLVDTVLATGSDPGTTLLGGYGVRWTVRLLGLLLLAWAWSRSRRGSPVPVTTALVGVVLACVGTVLLGHNGVAVSDRIRVAAASAHVAAALTWAGALGCLAVAMLLDASARRVPDVLATLRAFGPPAAACLGVTAVTGILLSSETVVSVDAALLTTYGRVLIVKVLLVGAAAGLGLRHHRRLRGPHDLDPPRRSVLVEAGLLAGVVGLTGLLASTATATDPTFVRAPAVPVGAVGRQVGDLQVAVDLSPNRQGAAVAVVDVFDTRRPAPAPVTGVDVRLAGARPVAADRLADGHWSAPVTIGTTGTTHVSVTVLRAGLTPASADFAWTVPGRQARTALVSLAPARTPLRTTAGGLAVALLAGWSVVMVRVRRRARAVDVVPPPAEDASLVPER